MQYLDDDMDELFREAAENYPLKVTGADWSKVQAALPKTASAPRAPNRKNMLWLLLLLFIPAVCTVFNNRNQDHNTVSEKIAPVAATTDKGSPAENKTVDQNNNAVDIAATIPKDNQTKNNILPGGAKPRNRVATVADRNSKKYSRASRQLYSTGDADIAVDHSNGKKHGIIFSQKAVTQLQVSPGETGTNALQNSAGKKNGDNTTEKTVVKQKPFTDFVEKDKKPADSSATAKKEKTKKQNSRGIYISLLAGPDLSTVKNDGVKKAGLSTGLSIGYNINKHFAAEAGVFYSEKHYKSDYKNFNNSKTQWPSGAEITNLKGTCKMIELPVTLRYNFHITKKNKFFAAAGLSSYIMKKEVYDYNYNYYGYSGYADKSYNNSSRNWLAVLQLSAGWQRNIGKKIAVRVQPYYNVPLKGVGIGSLPISGAGVLAGFTIPIK